MGEWKKTSCVLCSQNCGLEVLVENNRILRAPFDREIKAPEDTLRKWTIQALLPVSPLIDYTLLSRS